MYLCMKPLEFTYQGYETGPFIKGTRQIDQLTAWFDQLHQQGFIIYFQLSREKGYTISWQICVLDILYVEFTVYLIYEPEVMTN